MMSASATGAAIPAHPVNLQEKTRRAALGPQPEVLPAIYDADTNIAVWQRELPVTMQESVAAFLRTRPGFQTSMTLAPQGARLKLNESLGTLELGQLSADIAELVDMFCCLFELNRVGLRMTALDHAMCPKFHVDRVPCRLVTTYHGTATQWLPHQLVNREKLGLGSNGLPDHQSGLYAAAEDIQQLSCGDVALLKGELWEGNENAGLVHRSPMLLPGTRRLLLTLDFMNN